MRNSPEIIHFETWVWSWSWTWKALWTRGLYKVIDSRYWSPIYAHVAVTITVGPFNSNEDKKISESCSLEYECTFCFCINMLLSIFLDKK